MIRILCLTAVVAAIAATPAHSQSRRELAERIDATEVRVGQLEAQFLAGDPVLETLLERLDALDFQVRELNGNAERLQFENRQLRQQVESLQAELDAMRAPAQPVTDPATLAFMSEGLGVDGEPGAEAGPAEGAVEDDAPAANPRFAEARAGVMGTLGDPNAAAAEEVDPITIFDQGRARLADGDFDGAQFSFEQFATENPDHPMAGESLYWLGETHYVRGDFAASADAYIASMRTQPSGAKAPDALIRLAASLAGLGRNRDACDTLARFPRQFPNASQESRDRAARESVRANCR
ncbi:tol-pal system protein YbgF [Maricaulis sp.]|uniref:tol-pal system protein YbgF n=1 Tax=Maricaulis sp. TaxID=1486257 RepID=UPI002612F1BD|nr:tol-pal system protein YbgF [Maricaulis sp.]